MTAEFLVAAAVFLAAAALTFRALRARPAVRVGTFVMRLPDGWYEAEREPGAHCYRRRVEGSGELRVSLQPPLAGRVRSGRRAEQELARLVAGLGADLDLGERLALTSGRCALGVYATALCKSERHGLLQFWLIPAEATVFASYTMGSLDAVKQDLAEAMQIMRQVELR
jgi:hypothetical protein